MVCTYNACNYFADSHSPCSEICDSTIRQIRERERTQRKIITKLQDSNQGLIREVLELKEVLLLEGIKNM